jgi:predicted RecA/RadA family phage recombinase
MTMKNFVQPGDIVTVAAPADVSSGDLVVVGTLFGVAATDAKSGDPIEIKTSGVFTLPKTSAQAWTQGVKVYYDSENKVLTTTASTNTLIGHAVEAAGNPSSTGVVRLSI